MRKDNPRLHKATVTFEQIAGMNMEVWSYLEGAYREFHIALIGADGHTLGQGKFRIRALEEAKL